MIIFVFLQTLLECIMRISMEDLRGDLDNVLTEAITLWMNSTKFRWLFHIHRDTFQGVLLLKV